MNQGRQPFSPKKTLSIVGMAALFSLAMPAQLFATQYSEQTRLTISANNQTVKEILYMIEGQSDFRFIYESGEMNLDKRVTVNFKNQSVEAILDNLFGNAGIQYEITENNFILINPVGNSSKDTKAVAQQQKRITGKVVDKNGEPIIGANVVIKGSAKGTTTDINGNFSLEVPANAQLSISYIGYVAQEITVGNLAQFNVTLSEDTQNLDEVVVVGYGVVRKVDLAGSVSVMDDKSFKDQPITQVSDALQGRVSGVQVTGNAGPGGIPRIRVRGSGSINLGNDPLYVIDGIVRESGLIGLNPDDIQSIQILKDASSTAIYGSRGANGVVLITTKTGKAGKRQFTVDTRLSVGTVAKPYETLNASEFTSLYNTYRPGTFTGATPDVDWQDELFQTAFTQDYKVSFTGGNDQIQYLVSGNYVGEKGVVIGNEGQRYQGRANITSQVTDWLHLTADVNLSRNTRKNGDFNVGGNTSNVIVCAINYAPVVEMFKEDGLTYSRDPYNAVTSENPVGRMKEQPYETLMHIVNAHVDLKFDICKGLTFTTSNGLDYKDDNYYSFSTKKVSSWNGMSNYHGYDLMLQTTNNFTYTNKWNDHSLTATAVYEATQKEYRQLTISGSDLLTEGVGYWNVNMAANRNADNSYSKWTLMSGVARVMYNYKDRYMLTGTLRADGSSKFQNNKWGVFPSIAAAWSIGNEPFMKQQNIFQDLKLRTSYGVIGSQGIGPYDTLGLMEYVMFSFGGSSQYTGYWIGKSVETPDLTWEQTHQFDLGVDFATLDRRLQVSVDYFNKRTKDGLLRRNIPNYDGSGSYWVNAAEVNNKGVDFSINANLVDTQDFGWNTAVTGSYLKNEVISMPGLDFIDGSAPAWGLINDPVNRVQEGHPIGAFYGYKWKGLDENGRDSFEDLDNNGVIDSADRDFIGKSTPDFTLGWNNTLRWKNWDLNIFFTGSFGADRLNLIRYTGTAMSGDFAFISLKEYLTDNFDVKGQSARYPSVNVTGNNYQAAATSTKYLENASYFRLDNISLSYNLTKKMSKIGDFRFTLSAQNLFTITKYTGMDPAGVSWGSEVTNGVDMGAYPLARTFTFGVRMNF
ncbi:TonB-dependent receptor [Parabacteroides distasonis]|nr:TonB-dependent receptor [Parabacteroides distasonis]